jgi:hypothetical protein
MSIPTPTLARRGGALLAAVALTVGGLAVVSAPAEASYRAVRPGQYQIVNVESGKYLNAYTTQGNDYSGTRITASLPDGTAEQVFNIALVPGDTSRYLIGYSASNNGRVVDIYGNTVKEGSRIQLWTNTAYGSKHWYFDEVSSGVYVIRNAVNPSLVLTPTSDAYYSVRSFVYAQKYTSKNPLQKWRLEPYPATPRTEPKGGDDLGGGLTESDPSGGSSGDESHNITGPSDGLQVNGVVCSVPVSGQTYYLRSSLDLNYVIDVNGGGTAAGVTVNIYPKHGGTNQRWLLTDTGNGWTLTSVASGLVIDIYGAGTGDGTDIVQWYDNGGGNQRFTIGQSLRAGFYEIKAHHANLALDVQGGLVGTLDLWAYTPNGTAAQQWCFEAI